MGEDSLREDILHILRSFGSRISHFVSFLFDPMNATSIGALAGFAIAVICTWKYLKAPTPGRKRLEKRDGAHPSNESNHAAAAGTSTSVELHHSQTTQRGVVIREPEAPIQLTLAQIVRKQLNGCRKMTCQLLGVIFEESTPQELQQHAVVRPSVIEVLLELARSCDLYLISRVADDESEAIALAALDAIGLFTTGGLNRDKVLFCSTETGRASFVRQLEPDWHVDTSIETISQLARYIRSELHISPKGIVSTSSANVICSESLESYFGNLNSN